MKALRRDVGKFSVWQKFDEMIWGTGYKVVQNLPAMQETQARSLGQEVSLEKEMVSHSSILAWEIPWPGRVGHDLATE